jgi:hypothetical protein
MVSSNISVKLYCENCGAQQRRHAFSSAKKGLPRASVSLLSAKAGSAFLWARSSFGPGRKK